MNPRLLAVTILSTVLESKIFLQDALANNAAFSKLESPHRATVRNLVSTTLRYLGILDAIIGLHLKKPFRAKDVQGMHLLRLGACELLILNTPAHAAVFEYVKLSQKAKVPHLKKLINAILREINRQQPKTDLSSFTAKALPQWMTGILNQDWGTEATTKIAAAHLRNPPLDLSLKTKDHPFTEAMCFAPNHARIFKSGRVENLPDYEKGTWWVQDFAASLPGRLLGNIKGKTVLDACAAPGGKTAQLVAAGATVTALDKSPERMKILNQNLKRLKMTAETVTTNLDSFTSARAYDAILLDAPCSATGTVRRHPELPWIKNAANLTNLLTLQRTLLQKAATFLKPGGVLVYCTCSLFKQEGEDQITSFLKETPNFELKKITKDEFPFLEESFIKNGMLRTFPFQKSESGGVDGFFAACLYLNP